ncbi:MAG: ABC transporter permease [Candidatus Rokubacteria bacterium]|nr:ABC transporter permease [Candidatus Rokubacteria bacterium]
MSWRSELLAVWAIVVRNALMASRNVFFFFELLFWPIVGVLSIGLMTRFLRLTPEQASFVLIGTIALSVVNVCQLEVAYAVLLDVWSKSMKHQFLAPIGIRHLTAGSWLVGMARGLAIFVLLALLGGWAFDFDVLHPGWAALGAFLFGCFLTSWVVGVAVCALITLFGNRAEAFAWASVNLVLVLAGIYYPVSVLPEPVAALARAIPLTYFLDAYRTHYGFPSEFAAPVATGLALSALYAVLAHLAFLAAVRRARRTGLLLKMSE